MRLSQLFLILLVLIVLLGIEYCIDYRREMKDAVSSTEYVKNLRF